MSRSPTICTEFKSLVTSSTPSFLKLPGLLAPVTPYPPGFLRHCQQHLCSPPKESFSLPVKKYCSAQGSVPERRLRSGCTLSLGGLEQVHSMKHFCKPAMITHISLDAIFLLSSRLPRDISSELSVFDKSQTKLLILSSKPVYLPVLPSKPVLPTVVSSHHQPPTAHISEI